MRAARLTSFGDPLDVVSTGDLPEPVVGPDSVLLSVAAAGVNPVDWKIVAGLLQGAIPTHLPVIPGWDVAGTVLAVGPAVTEVVPGDRVAAYARKDAVEHGTFAERASVPVRSVARVPDGVDLTVAGAVPLAGLTALQCLDAVGVRSGETVLVHAAAGGVGTFATQLARLRGATVLGTAGEANHAHLRERGVEPLAYGDGLVERVRAAAPDGIDVVVDLVGGDAVTTAQDVLAPSGRVVSVVDAGVLEQPGGHYVFVRPDPAGLAELLRLVDDGSLHVDVAETYPLDRAAEALEASRAGHVRGKVVVTV